MDAKLQEAISIVENAGGFVMFPETEDEEIHARARILQIENEQDAELEQNRIKAVEEELEFRKDYLKRKKEAFREMRKVFNESPALTRMSDLENILLDNGLDMDEMEDWIESMV